MTDGERERDGETIAELQSEKAILISALSGVRFASTTGPHETLVERIKSLNSIAADALEKVSE